MAKKSIRLIPGLGWFMLMSGAVFIDRSNNKSAIASMTQAGEDMKRSNVRDQASIHTYDYITGADF
jgi:phosphatidylinositol glycan class A protein